MTTLPTPAPNGFAGLEFGAYGGTSGYTKAHPHQGLDHKWDTKNVAKSRETFASIGAKVLIAFNDGGYHSGWGNYVDMLIPATGHRIVHRLAHHQTGTVKVRVGQSVVLGTHVGTMGDTGKTKGIHLHEGLYIDGLPVDPEYYRTHDLPGTPSTAGGGGKPFPKPTVHKEDEMTVAVLLNNKHYFTVGEEFISHNSNQAQADITRKVNSTTDELHKMNTAQFNSYLDGMGIPRSVVDVNTGKVLNPQSGEKEGNGVWSRRREAVALSQTILTKLNGK